MSRWIEAVIHKPVTVAMITLAAIVFGMVSVVQLPVELLPEISYPSMTILTELPDAAPEEVEQLVTRPLEQVVGVVGGLERATSISRSGVSEVTLEFGWDTDMTFASLDVREKLDLVDLPDDARAPVIYRFDPSLDPIQRVAILGEFDVRDLRKIGEDVVKKNLETIKGVAAAKVVGGAEEEVHVEIDEGRLSAMGMTVDEVAVRIGEENINRSGGELRDSNSAYLLRTVKLYESLEDISNTILRDSPDGGRVLLGDVATVSFGTEDREVRVRVDGVPAVELHLYKEGDANAVRVAQAVRERLQALQESRVLAGLELKVLFDQARYIEDAVENVKVTAILGAILAALVLFLFLRDLFSTLVIALSIPISIAVTFLLMHLAGVSFNVMSLGGLALGIGMLVDNSVVVLEAVARRREEGAPFIEAVVHGTSEVVGGIISSTLTTISVFLPLIFVEGVSGQLFRDQALTVTFSLLVSLLVAVTVIPAILGRKEAVPGPLARVSTWLAKGVELALRPLTYGVQVAMDRTTQLYGRTLDVIARAPWGAPLLALVLFVAIVPTVTQLGRELVPDLFQGEIYYDLELADGTPLEGTDRKIAQMEQVVDELRAQGEPIDLYYVSVGGTPVLGDVRAGDRQDHLGRVSLSLSAGTTQLREQQLVSALDQRFAAIPDCNVRLGKPTLFTFRDPIEVEIFSEDLDDLWSGARAIQRNVAALPGLIDVQSTLEARSPEIHVDLDPIKLSRLLLSRGQVARTLAQMGVGEVPTQYTFGEKPIDIRVRVAGARDGSPSDVGKLTVSRSAGGVRIPLSAVGELKERFGPVEVLHVGGERAAVVTARLEGADLASASEQVIDTVRQTPLPTSVTARLSGQNEEMRESLNSLLMALGLAIFLVYLVLASSFESLSLPFVIILTVPLGLIGAVLALVVTSSTLNVFAMIGVILLCGIVVNNGIIYIARIQQHRDAGQPPAAAIRQAGIERIRPMFITSATTILGLLPLALGTIPGIPLGEGVELRQPLAITVIGGLTVATFLTLQVIPSGYLLLTRKRSSALTAATTTTATTAATTAHPAAAEVTEPTQPPVSDSAEGEDQ